MTNQEHAVAIAKKLMTNREGQVADRLAMQKKMNVGFGFDKEHDLGGRNAASVTATILEYLDKHFSEDSR